MVRIKELNYNSLRFFPKLRLNLRYFQWCNEILHDLLGIAKKLFLVTFHFDEDSVEKLRVVRRQNHEMLKMFKF